MAPTVRALVVSPPVPVWGAQLYLLEQVDALRERGVELTLGTPATSEFGAAWRARGFPLLDLGLDERSGLRATGSERGLGVAATASSARAVLTSLRNVASVARQFDVLYSFSLRSHVEVALAGRLTGTPAVLDLVDIVRPGLGRRILRGTARVATLTIANSQATADLVRSAGAVRVVHPAIDLGRFHAAPRNDRLRTELQGGVDRPLVAVVGRLDEGKGVHVLVEAMALQAAESPAGRARLVVVGERGTGPMEYTERLKNDAQRLLGDRVVFVGRRDDVADIIRAVDVLVVASRAEPFGLTALEAQACRTAVVGTDAGGLPEFVIDGETGLLVPPFEPQPLADAIARMLGDDALRARLVDEAERRANPARGLEAQYNELAELYWTVALRRPIPKETDDG